MQEQHTRPFARMTAHELSDLENDLMRADDRSTQYITAFGSKRTDPPDDG